MLLVTFNKFFTELYLSALISNGDKFKASFKEVDLLVNINLTNAMSYFFETKRGGKLNFDGKLGVGYNIYNSIRTNLFTDTYVHDFGYEMEGTKNGEVEPNRKQTRYKYSPAHQDAHLVRSDPPRCVPPRHSMA